MLLALPELRALGPAYEFGYNAHPAIASSFLCIRTIDSNV